MKKVRIRLADITKSYYSETTVTQALRKINLTFCQGEFVAITGESGSGKSTLLNIIGGMEPFDDGEMYVDGEVTSQFDDEDWEEYRRNKIGYVFQDYSLVGHYTALDNVMSALLIMEKSVEESRTTALAYLKRVGLEGFEAHRATELSSGQKQRLSIARALAKGTGIIVADEPTGNLDRETGDQIIQLLKELSKECLVIMVTHNYDQVEPYATRKIRLHDGEMISDVSGAGEEVPEPVAGKTTDTSENSVYANVESGSEAGKATSTGGESAHAGGESEPEAGKPSDTGTGAMYEDGTSGPASGNYNEKKARKRQTRTAAHFARLNRHTQKGRAFLFTIFLTIVSAVAFIFIAELYQHGDDVHTRVYDNSAFLHEDDTRIAVKREDGAPITDKDLAALKSIPNVVTADSCDVANDINYYIKEDEDYRLVYGIMRDWSGTTQTVDIKFINDKRFVRSTDCIEQEDLAYGRMPEARNEMVLYAGDDSALNTSVSVYFTATNLWEQDNYYKTDIKVCGILKKRTDQVYFSRELCQMMSMHADSDSFRLKYNWEPRTKSYASDTEYIPVIANDLVGNQVRVAEVQETPPTGDTLFHLGIHDSDGRDLGGSKEEIVKVLDHHHDFSGNFMEVSQEFYDKHYQWKGEQAAVYVINYAKVKQVIRDMKSLGFAGISTYKVSSGDYNQELVDSRIMIVSICAGGLVALFAAAVLIMRSLMKIRVKDYFILKFIGMRLKMIGLISYFEMFIYSLWAMFLAVAVMWILRFAGIPVLNDLMWYMSWDAYLFYGAYLLLLWLVTAASFNHLLKGRLRS